MKSMIKSDKAVSEVLGMIMMLSVTMLVIGSIMLVGIPMIESGKDRAKTDVAVNYFLSLQNDIEEVVRGPIWIRDPKITKSKLLGPSRETEFELMEGTITVMPNGTLSNITIVNVSGNLNGSNYTIKIPLNNIIYMADNDDIIYENGAVIRKYETGEPLMISDPLINIYNNGSNGTIVSIHAIMLNGTSSSVGGDGKAWIETRLENYSRIVESLGDVPNTNQTNITIYSKYPNTWRTFFEKKLKGAGLSSPGNCASQGYDIRIINSQMINVTIYGKECSKNKDIFLSVYESKLDVNVR